MAFTLPLLHHFFFSFFFFFLTYLFISSRSSSIVFSALQHALLVMMCLADKHSFSYHINLRDAVQALHLNIHSNGDCRTLGKRFRMSNRCRSTLLHRTFLMESHMFLGFCTTALQNGNCFSITDSLNNLQFPS